MYLFNDRIFFYCTLHITCWRLWLAFITPLSCWFCLVVAIVCSFFRDNFVGGGYDDGGCDLYGSACIHQMLTLELITPFQLNRFYSISIDWRWYRVQKKQRNESKFIIISVRGSTCVRSHIYDLLQERHCAHWPIELNRIWSLSSFHQASERSQQIHIRCMSDSSYTTRPCGQCESMCDTRCIWIDCSGAWRSYTLM